MQREKRKHEYFPIPSLAIGLWRIKNQTVTELHNHDFTEIAIVEKGHGKHLFEKTVLPVGTGDVFVIDSKCRHAWVEAHDMTVVNVMIGDLRNLPLLTDLKQHPAFDALFVHEPKLRQHQKGKGRLQLDMAQLDQARQTVQRLERALHEKGEGRETSAKIQLLALMDLLCNAYVEAPRKHHQTVLRAGQVIRKLEENWQNQTSNQELARIMHVSLATFYRLFREAAGCTPAQYVGRLRIRHACNLLRTTDNTVSEISSQAGFPDSNYFSRIFRRVIGTSPRAYRRGGAR